MFYKISVHAWSWCGGLKEELSILVSLRAQIHGNTSWDVKTSLTLNELI